MYVLNVEQLERRVAAEMQAAATLKAAGFKTTAGDIDIPDPVTERERFDAALNAPPQPLSRVASLIRELGVA